MNSQQTMSLIKDKPDFPNNSLVAMIGLMPLPDSPGYGGSEQAIVDRALKDLEIYASAGVDALLIENSGDLPYMKPPVSDEAFQLVEHVANLIRMRFSKPIGLQLLEAANEQAMEVAASAGLNFIRVEGYVFAHVGGAGIIEGSAGKILRLRKELRADSVQVFADVKKKHCSHAITGDLDISEHVKQADFFHADGIIVTGPRTGAEPCLDDLQACRKASQLPVLIGSGMTPNNVKSYFPYTDGLIVGSSFRKNGQFLEELCPDRLEVFMEEFRRLKSAACTE